MQMNFYPVLTPQDMRNTEERAFALGVPSTVLMEQAAAAVVNALETELGGSCRGKKSIVPLRNGQ